MKMMVMVCALSLPVAGLAIQNSGPPGPANLGPDAETNLEAVATNLALGEYGAFWMRFRIGTIMLFTDRAIELEQRVNAIVSESEPDEDIASIVREFTADSWAKTGAELGRMTVANGVDSGSDWILFAQSAADQLVQRILQGDNNWPQLGQELSDQAMVVVRDRHDQKWQRFGETVGEAMDCGTPTQWRQWGLQVAAQARARRTAAQVDWVAFGEDVLQQARWLAKSMRSAAPRLRE